MSITITYPIPIDITRVKQFFFNVKDARGVERGIGGYYNADTTQVGTTSTTRVNLKTYTFTSSAKTNKVRIRVWQHGTYTDGYNQGTLYININGTDVKTYISYDGVSRVVEYIGDLTPNTSYTIKINATCSSDTYYVDKVYINAGYGLTSTTSVNLVTITLDTANTDSYILKSSGNFVFNMGLRWWIRGNRKTTASASFSSTLANEIQGVSNLNAGDDGDNNAFITIRTNNYPGDNASFTISGNVGASGDLIIITGIYAQVLFRGNLTDSLNNANIWFLLIKEKGFVSWTQELLSIDGGSYANVINVLTKGGYKQMYASSTGTDVVSTLSFSSNDSPEICVHIGNNEDSSGKVFCAYVNVIILGV
jgi:hypothetical protein